MMSKGRQGLPSSWNPRGRLECRMMLLKSVTQFLRGSVFPRRRGLFCKHVERIYNELLLCRDGKELMGD